MEIGGHFELSDTYKGIKVYIECNNPCEIDSCGTALIYHVNSLINANNEDPFEYILRRDEMDLAINTFKVYSIKIN
jgi:hypothetical protein